MMIALCLIGKSGWRRWKLQHLEPAGLYIEHSHPDLVENSLTGRVRDEQPIASAMRELHAAYAAKKRLRPRYQQSGLVLVIVIGHV